MHRILASSECFTYTPQVNIVIRWPPLTVHTTTQEDGEREREQLKLVQEGSSMHPFSTNCTRLWMPAQRQGGDWSERSSDESLRDQFAFGASGTGLNTNNDSFI